MDVAGVRRHLRGHRFGDVRWTAETTSTNSDLVSICENPLARELVLVTDHQSAGRGRLDRRWEAPAGSGLLTSILLRDPLGQRDLGRVTPALALAMVAALDTCYGVRAGIKWPNDVVVEDGPAPGKLAGILAEAVTIEGEVVGVVAGIGCNIAWPAAPGEGPPGATSLAMCASGAADRGDLLVALLRCFADRLDRIDAVIDEYRARCTTLGRAVSVDRGPAGVLVGIARGVTDDGRLVVDCATGEEHLSVGDVVHLRH